MLGRYTGKIAAKIVGSDGTVISNFNRTFGTAPPRPFEINLRVPPGQWTIAVTTDTGLSGEAHFKIDSADQEYRVKVDVK